MSSTAELPPSVEPTGKASTETPVAPPPERGQGSGRSIWLWIVCAIVLTLGLIGIERLWKSSAAHAAEGNLPVVAAARVERENLAQVVTISGEFRPYQQVALHAKVAGFLQAINVDVGDRVKEGQEIARLDVPELKNELEKATAALKASEEEVSRAEASYSDAHLSYTRLKDVARQRPNLVAQQDLDTVQAKDLTSSGSVSVAKSRVEECRAEMNRVQALVGYTTISAPFDGVITRRFFDPGALVQGGTTTGQPIVDVAEDKKLRFVFPVPESVVPTVKVGAKVQISVSSTGENINAPISRFASKVDRATRTMSTEVDVENADGHITPGMYASVVFTVRESQDAVAVPIQAIAFGEHPTVLAVGTDGVVQEHAVKLGLQTPDKAEILEGLKPGDMVIVGTRSGIRPGQKVVTKLIEPAPAA
jgi:RND family efflux transporter MFP subunit